MNFLPTFQIFIAVGFVWVLSTLHKLLSTRVFRFIFYVLCFMFLLNIIYYLHQYFVVQNNEYSKHWQYGYKEAVSLTKSLEDSYGKIVVSNQSPLDQSYIFFLYYLKYPPEQYQQEQGKVKSFSKYVFRPIKWSEEEKGNDTLYIGRPQDFPSTIKPLKTVSYLNGEPAMYFVEP